MVLKRANKRWTEKKGRSEKNVSVIGGASSAERVLFAAGWPEIFLKESFQAGDREKNIGEEQRFERVNEHWREDFGAWGEARGRGGADSATYEGEFFGVFFLSLGRKV